MNGASPSGIGPPSFLWSLLCSCSSSPTAGPKATVSCCAGVPAPPSLHRKGCWQPQSTQEQHRNAAKHRLPLHGSVLLSLAPFGPRWASFGLNTEPSKPQTFPAHLRRSCLVFQSFFSLLIVTCVCPLPQGHKSQPPPSVTFQVRFFSCFLAGPSFIHSYCLDLPPLIALQTKPPQKMTQL